jgi:hypothetical protein
MIIVLEGGEVSDAHLSSLPFSMIIILVQINLYLWAY